MNTVQDQNRARSAIAPDSSAAVMIANISSNMAKAASGRPFPTTSPGIRKPTKPNPPISPAWESPKPSEKPNNTQINPTTPSVTMLIIIMLSALRARTMPA
jgi:cell division septation protein DedD